MSQAEPTVPSWTIHEWAIEGTYTSTHDKGEERPEPVEKSYFSEECALAVLLAEEVVFLNTGWNRKEWPEEARKAWMVYVICNDVFAWGCSDAEFLPYDQVENVYRMWRKDPSWGPAIWCMLQRKEMPQKPVEDAIRKAGIWNLDALNLNKNTTAAEVEAFFKSIIKGGT